MSLSVAEAIREEAAECRKSSANNANEPHNREIFYLVSFILDNIADKIERKGD